MIFAPTIINNTKPQVSVQVADSGNPAVTYAQVKQSLGSQVYKVDEFYLYATTLSQLIGAILYNRYDVSGNIDKHSIVTTADPYQGTNAIYVDLTKYQNDVILNGNSSLQATILPNNYLQLKLICRRITNSFGMNKFNFNELEQIFKKDFYAKVYSDFETDGKLVILNGTSLKNEEKYLKNFDGEVVTKNDKESLALLSLASFSFLFYLIYKNE
jgi:hypothetical protein